MRQSMFMKVVLFLLGAIFTLAIGFTAEAEGVEQTEPRLLIIAAPGLSLMELKQMVSDPSWSSLLQQAKVGAMNLRTRDAKLENRYMSMSLSYDATGMDPDQHMNDFIGERLRQNHIQRAVWGTTSSELLQDRFGTVDTELTAKPWLKAIETIQGPVVLMKEWKGLNPSTSHEQDVLQRLKKEIEQVWQRMKEGDTLWILSPFVHDEARKAKSHLAPFLVLLPPDQATGDWLYSATTRRAGLVSYKDIAPSIMDTFNMHLPQSERGDMEGHPLQTSGLKGKDQQLHVQKLLELTDRIESVYQLRPQILYPLVMFEAAVLIMSLLLLYWRPDWVNGAVVLRLLLMSLLTVPGVLLVMGAFPGLHPRAYMTALLGLILWSILPVLRYSWANVLFGVSILTVLLILVDGWTGAALMKQSILGYDPIIGARFYGIGNEYMGVLIGTALVAAGILRRKRLFGKPLSNVFIIAVLCLVLTYLALPQGGANAGGTITAAVAFGCFLLFQSGLGNKRFSSWSFFLITVILLPVVGFLVLFLFNKMMPNSASSSHIGQGLSHLLAGDMEWILKIIQRKLEMNVHLIGASNWGKLLLAGILVFATNLLVPRFKMGRLWPRKYKHWKAVFSSIAAGALTAFAFNDSGLVAAATLIVYAAVPLIWIQAESRTDVDYINASQSS